MYEIILVALDGSKLAERIIDAVEPLAQKFDSLLVLLRATASPEMIITGTAVGSPGAIPPTGALIDPTPIVEADLTDARGYLDGLEQRLRERGLRTKQDIPEGPAAEQIIARAREHGAGLIAMTTHGRGGLGRLVFGSVADEVLRTVTIPVLLLRVQETGRGEARRP
ncbi:MAG: universal stress protein [Chloroflexota bacterium]